MFFRILITIYRISAHRPQGLTSRPNTFSRSSKHDHRLPAVMDVCQATVPARLGFGDPSGCVRRRRNSSNQYVCRQIGAQRLPARINAISFGEKSAKSYVCPSYARARASENIEGACPQPYLVDDEVRREAEAREEVQDGNPAGVKQ